MLLYIWQVHLLSAGEILRILHELWKTIWSYFPLQVSWAIRLRRFVAAVYKLLFKLIESIFLVASSFIHTSFGVWTLSMVWWSARDRLIFRRPLLSVLGVLRAGRRPVRIERCSVLTLCALRVISFLVDQSVRILVGQVYISTRHLVFLAHVSHSLPISC